MALHVLEVVAAPDGSLYVGSATALVQDVMGSLSPSISFQAVVRGMHCWMVASSVGAAVGLQHLVTTPSAP